MKQAGSLELIDQVRAGRLDVAFVAHLEAEPFVDFQPDWGSRDAVDALLPDRRIAFEVNDVHSLLDLVTFGLGVAVVPQSFSVKTDRVQFVGLADQPPPWQTGVVTSRTASAAATALLDAVAAAKSGA